MALAAAGGLSLPLRNSQQGTSALGLSSSVWGLEGRGKLMKSSDVEGDRFFHASKSTLPRVEARLFGPAIFEASKLRVLFLDLGRQNHPEQTPRTYTLTHSDLTAMLTLAISREINKAQFMGWYSRLQRDEVLAEWKKVKGHMALHVHCHISGGHFLHNFIARLRFYIFRKELPVVLAAFLHGDRELFKKYPELEKSLVWVYFHSNIRKYNRLECWGPLVEACMRVTESAAEAFHHAFEDMATEKKWPQQLWPRPMCSYPCDCCSRHGSLIPLPESFSSLNRVTDEVGQGNEGL